MRPSNAPIKATRIVFQSVLAVLCLVAGIRYSQGFSLSNIEKYCPFGGLETAWAFFTNRTFSCATGEANLALFLSLLGLTIIARKSFCAWVCPVGTISEWTLSFRGRFRRLRAPWLIGGAADRILRWLRLPALAVVLTLTYRTGELVFRGYDPYYIIFSMRGHDVRWWSYGVLLGILLLSFAIPMGWCRYLCPLGGALWPFARFGILRIRRDGASCTDCGRCDRSCPQGITVSREIQVRSGECTLCLECVEACPTRNVLTLHAGTGRV